jgi:hypothetical protein
MKKHMRNIIVAIVLGVLSLNGAHGASNQVERLNDSQLAAVRGGYCFFFKCADGPDGDCQPIEDDAKTLCMEVTCRLELDSADGVDIVECKTSNGVTTCSENDTYIQCVRSKFPTVCYPDSNSDICGYQVDAGCFPDLQNRVCYCDTYSGGGPCDWQSCLQLGGM